MFPFLLKPNMTQSEEEQKHSSRILGHPWKGPAAYKCSHTLWAQGHDWSSTLPLSRTVEVWIKPFSAESPVLSWPKPQKIIWTLTTQSLPLSLSSSLTHSLRKYLRADKRRIPPSWSTYHTLRGGIPPGVGQEADGPWLKTDQGDTWAWSCWSEVWWMRAPDQHILWLELSKKSPETNFFLPLRSFSRTLYLLC